jgi:hypothetical protein
MKFLKVYEDKIELELSIEEISILHYALYDYLAKIEAKLKQKNLDVPQRESHMELKENIQQMTEMLSLLI